VSTANQMNSYDCQMLVCVNAFLSCCEQTGNKAYL